MSTTPQIETENLTIQTQECVTRLLTTMGFTEAKVTCIVQLIETDQPISTKQLRVSIEAGEAGRLLIGAHGEHLHALQHVIRSLLYCQIQENIRVTIDVNSYVAYRERSLQQLAEHTARKAQHSGRAVVLRPMTAFERRVIHTALASRSDVRTESLGEEPNRRVIVKPVFM